MICFLLIFLGQKSLKANESHFDYPHFECGTYQVLGIIREAEDFYQIEVYPGEPTLTKNQKIDLVSENPTLNFKLAGMIGMPTKITVKIASDFEQDEIFKLVSIDGLAPEWDLRNSFMVFQKIGNSKCRN